MERYGYGIEDGIIIGHTLGMLYSQLVELIAKIGELSTKHNMIESINILAGEELAGNDDEEVNKNLPNIKQIITSVNIFNKNIGNFNKNNLKRMSSYFPNLPPLKIVDKKELLTQLNKRFLKSYRGEESQKLANEVLDLKIISILNEPANSILNLRKSFSDLFKDININLSKKYTRGFKEARIILSTGCSETAVFVVGRTIETIINDLLINEIKKSKIQKMDLKNTKLENKIGKLKGVSIISDKEFHILQRLKFDRNDFGHPFDREVSFNEAKRIILDALDLAMTLEKKLV
ncbi:DUF4145 domain-containing protein [Candidatus Pacearchaeota archaeon]|nr:DUF4145 domain-containing protein [Candidatus Pacearchaeota archaeon]